MLSERLIHLREQPAPALVAVAAGLLLGFALALATQGSAGAVRATTTVVSGGAVPRTPAASAGEAKSSSQGVPSASAPPTGAAAASGAPVGPAQRRMHAALVRGVAAAERYGGTAEAAVWVDGWPAPAVDGDAAPMRMWSMSKAVTGVAVLRHAPLSPELQTSLHDALTLSDNCAQRRVVVGLQRLAGGIDGAAAAFRDVLAQAGARAALPPQASGPDANCVAYLRAHAAGVANPLANAYQYGTATWTVTDAVHFAHALADGTYGSAGTSLLALLRLPKGVSVEAGPHGFTADYRWGAGNAFAAWRPAYKAGWGGSKTGRFLVGQIAVVQVGAHAAAVAAMYRPQRQPTADDPGQVNAATGLEALLDAVANELARTQGAG